MYYFNPTMLADFNHSLVALRLSLIQRNPLSCSLHPAAISRLVILVQSNEKNLTLDILAVDFCCSLHSSIAFAHHFIIRY